MGRENRDREGEESGRGRGEIGRGKERGREGESQREGKRGREREGGLHRFTTFVLEAMGQPHHLLFVFLTYQRFKGSLNLMSHLASPV